MSPRDTPDKGKGKRPKERAKGVPGRGEDDNVTYVNFGNELRHEVRGSLNLHPFKRASIGLYGTLT